MSNTAAPRCCCYACSLRPLELCRCNATTPHSDNTFPRGAGLDVEPARGLAGAINGRGDATSPSPHADDAAGPSRLPDLANPPRSESHRRPSGWCNRLDARIPLACVLLPQRRLVNTSTTAHRATYIPPCILRFYYSRLRLMTAKHDPLSHYLVPRSSPDTGKSKREEEPVTAPDTRIPVRRPCHARVTTSLVPLSLFPRSSLVAPDLASETRRQVHESTRHGCRVVPSSEAAGSSKHTRTGTTMRVIAEVHVRSL